MPRPLELHNRREFCKRITSVAAISSGVATLFPACSGNPTSSIPGSPLPTVAGASRAVPWPSRSPANSPLAATGGMALVTSTAGNFLVTRTGPATFIALTANCTHQACVVSGSTGSSFCMSVPRIGIRYVGPGRRRPRRRAAQSIPDAVCQQHPDHHLNPRVSCNCIRVAHSGVSMAKRAGDYKPDAGGSRIV